MSEIQVIPVAGDTPAEISYVDILIAFGEEKFLIFGLTLLAALIGIAVSLSLTPVYTAKTTLLPPQQGGSSGMSASLGALAATAGIAIPSKSSEELYLGLLKTDTVMNALITRFQLKDRYESENLSDARKTLAKNVRVSSDRKSSLITIDVDDNDPNFAAQLANAHLEELRALLNRITITEAQQRRVFFEAQSVKAKDNLVNAELAVKQAQDKGGLVSVDAQTQTMIGAAAQLRGQIVAREVQLQAIRSYAGPDNQELRKLSSELASMRAQLAKMENGGDNSSAATTDYKVALGNVRLYRELKYQEAIYTAMLQQFQLAKVEEAKDAQLIQQIDIAMAPDKKSKPSRSVVILAFVFVGFLLGILLAFVRRLSRSAAQDTGAWRAISAAWSLRIK
jgi:tyrosine-protein kinase Etk/Wzc